LAKTTHPIALPDNQNNIVPRVEVFASPRGPDANRLVALKPRRFTAHRVRPSGESLPIDPHFLKTSDRKRFCSIPTARYQRTHATPGSQIQHYS